MEGLASVMREFGVFISVLVGEVAFDATSESGCLAAD